MTPGPRPLSGQPRPTSAGAVRPYSYGHDGAMNMPAAAANAAAPIPHAARAVPPAANQPTAGEHARTQHAGAVYGETEPLEYSDGEGEYSDEEVVVRKKPLDRFLGRREPSGGIGAGYGGVDGVRREKRGNWKLWR